MRGRCSTRARSASYWLISITSKPSTIRTDISVDAVLKEAAQRMIGCTRPYDTVGRYGGEEFLAVLVSADESISLALAERMRVAIESRPFATESGGLHVTASLGTAASTSASPTDSKALL